MEDRKKIAKDEIGLLIILSYIAPITEQTAFSTFLAFFPFKRIHA